VTSPKRKQKKLIIISIFLISNFLENYFVFSKFEFGKFLPFMEILNFKFDNYN
jgi:hypothetical protein